MANARLHGPTDIADVSPSDTVDSTTEIISNVAHGDRTPAGIMVTGDGNVRVKMVSGSTVTVPGLVAGNMYAMQYTHVLSTGTTATGIKALFQ